MGTDQRYLIKYYRLSSEDRDSDGESGSIANQRRLINSYIAKDQELKHMVSLEFADDGYTGSNTNRPGLIKIEALLRRNQIRCIIVKDFSRFTRDYLYLGSYLEQILPFLKVRFISINDRYDSLFDSSGIEVQFKGLLNNLYSSDVSVKVKTGKRQLIKNGKKSSGSSPYGYINDVTEESIYLIDEPAAQIVRKIFHLAGIGMKNIEIARYLNEREIPPPSVYKRNNGNGDHGSKQVQQVVWDSTKILTIIRNETYKGTLTLGRYMSAGLGLGKTIEAPRAAWYRKANAFAAIISDQEFELVQSLRPTKKKAKYRERHILEKKVKCGYCGKYLYHKPSESGVEYNSFYCKQPHLTKCQCFTGYIKEQDLLDSLLKLIRCTINIDACSKKIRKPNSQHQLTQRQIMKLQRQLNRLTTQKVADYECYRQRQISKDEYLLKKSERDSNWQQLTDKLTELKKANEKKTITDDLIRISEFDQIKLTKRLITQLVDTIWVYDIDQIKLKLTYYDPTNCGCDDKCIN